MAEFRKKPVVISAVKWRGDNWNEVHDFLQELEGNMWKYAVRPTDNSIDIETLEGTMKAQWKAKKAQEELDRRAMEAIKRMKIAANLYLQPR